MNTVVVAAGQSLVDSYNKLTSGFFESQAGGVVVATFYAIAVVLAVGLLAAIILKGLGRTGKIVQFFFPSAKRLVIIVLVIFALLGPTIVIPAFLKGLQWFVDFMGGAGKNYYGL